MTRRNTKRESIHMLPEPGFTCFECEPNLTVTLDDGSDPVAAWREHYQAEHFVPIVTVGDAS